MQSPHAHLLAGEWAWGDFRGEGYRPVAPIRLWGMEGRLLTAGEVADHLRVKRSWVYAETRAGRIPHVRLGRYVRYSPGAVERWISEKAQIGGRGR